MTISTVPLTARVATIHRTRTTAAQAVADVLRDPVGWSELDLCRHWLATMRADDRLLPAGWYAPPPSGLSVLVGDPPDFHRTTYESLRPQERWPRADRRIGPKSLIYAFASPVDWRTMMIGDIGFTLYTGDDPMIRSHIAECLDITSQVVEYAEVGMELRELYHHASNLIRRTGLANQVSSSTDPTGHNIGHTVPWSHDDPSPTEATALASGDHERVASAISHARVFLNEQETLTVQPTMAFTIEPRMTAPGRPLTSFHIIVTFTDGRKNVAVDFDHVLRASGMTSYLDPTSLRRLGVTP